MPDAQHRYNELIAKLKERDYRLTPQRIELIRLISVSDGHPSANQLYEKVKVKFPTMSEATVYKTLSMLKEMKQVVEIDLRDDSHYDGNKPYPHPHLVCIRCQKIVDGEIELDASLINKLEEDSGYQVIRSHIIMYGLCPDCKALA